MLEVIGHPYAPAVLVWVAAALNLVILWSIKKQMDHANRVQAAISTAADTTGGHLEAIQKNQGRIKAIYDRAVSAQTDARRSSYRAEAAMARAESQARAARGAAHAAARDADHALESAARASRAAAGDPWPAPTPEQNNQEMETPSNE